MSVQRPPGRSAGPGIPECQQSIRGQSQSKAPSKKKGAPKDAPLPVISRYEMGSGA